MFVLSIVRVLFFSYILLSLSHTWPTQDKIPIHPSQFGLPPEQALINELNKKYANRVLHDVGLCICVFDIAEAGEGKVRYGDGFLWYTGQSQSHISVTRRIGHSCVQVDRLSALPHRSNLGQSKVFRREWHTV
jgi:hypothetical protein